MLDPRRYFQVCVLLPVVVQPAVYLLQYLSFASYQHLSESLRPLPWLLNLCLGFWGFAYALFAAYALWAIRRLSVTEIVRTLWIAPLFFVPIRLLVFVVLLPAGTFSTMEAWPFWFKLALFLVTASLGFGYAYAAVCYSAFWFGRRAGILGSLPEPPRSCAESVAVGPSPPPSATTSSNTEYDY